MTDQTTCKSCQRRGELCEQHYYEAVQADEAARAHDAAPACAICDAPAVVVNEATDAAPAYPACADHVKDGYSVIDTPAAAAQAAAGVRRTAAASAAAAAQRWLLNNGPHGYDLAEAEFHLTQALADVRRARELDGGQPVVTPEQREAARIIELHEGAHRANVARIERLMADCQAAKNRAIVNGDADDAMQWAEFRRGLARALRVIQGQG